MSIGSSNESRRERARRLGRISWQLLRSDRRLLAFPLMSVLINVGVGALAFGLAAHWIGAHHRSALLVASLIASYPLTFATTMFGVALAAMLDARLTGRPFSVGTGWEAARKRMGIIAAWSLITCTVGALLTLVAERLPLGGKILAWLGDISWSLATLFAIPVLAYENLGPIATLKRSSALFRQRWAEQTAGVAAIGIVSGLVSLPFSLLLVGGLAAGGPVGVILFACGGAGLIGIASLDTAVNQVFRVFLYRDASGVGAAGEGPFTADDLNPLWIAAGRRWSLAGPYRSDGEYAESRSRAGNYHRPF